MGTLRKACLKIKGAEEGQGHSSVVEHLSAVHKGPRFSPRARVGAAAEHKSRSESLAAEQMCRGAWWMSVMLLLPKCIPASWRW